MAFDVSEEKVGTEIGGIPVYHLDELEERLSTDIQVAILTVPATVAQAVADRLAETNVHGILNFTPARLNVSENIRIHHIDLAVELQTLVYFLKNYPQ
jgi:redox-sensing transcriptional repressor